MRRTAGTFFFFWTSDPSLAFPGQRSPPTDTSVEPPSSTADAFLSIGWMQAGPLRPEGLTLGPDGPQRPAASLKFEFFCDCETFCAELRLCSEILLLLTEAAPSGRIQRFRCFLFPEAVAHLPAPQAVRPGWGGQQQSAPLLAGESHWLPSADWSSQLPAGPWRLPPPFQRGVTNARAEILKVLGNPATNTPLSLPSILQTLQAQRVTQIKLHQIPAVWRFYFFSLTFFF